LRTVSLGHSDLRTPSAALIDRPIPTRREPAPSHGGDDAAAALLHRSMAQRRLPFHDN
jgi:hypothetical protein